MDNKSFYDRFLKAAPLLVVIFFILQAVLSTRLAAWLHPEPFAAIKVEKMDQGVASSLRAAALLSGHRVLVGNAFWITVIQYYGDTDNSVTRYAKLYDYCSLASDLNPQYIEIYTFGAAALAFHLKRIDEAARLLEKGIRANPQDRRLRLMLAAIGFAHTEQYELIVPILEMEIMRGGAPTAMINILANIYMKVGRYQEAIRLWQRILRDSEAAEQKIEAAQKLQELYAIVKAGNDKKK
jgi:pentatricopeptide repeat protein